VKGARPARKGRDAQGTKAAGDAGEALAAEHLKAAGYAIVARNHRSPLGEIDLIATRGEFLVFVEVKTRRGNTGYHPTLAMDARKIGKLRSLASLYLAEHPELELQPRFDVVAVVLSGPRPQVEHIENAF